MPDQEVLADTTARNKRHRILMAYFDQFPNILVPSYHVELLAMILSLLNMLREVK